MTIQEQLAELTRFMALEALAERIELPQAFLPEAPQYVIPSIALGKDGLVLASVLLVTDNFLCDIRLQRPQGSADFDFVDRKSIKNYRVVLWTHPIKENNVVTATYEIASVALLHDISQPFPSSFQTKLDYAGQRRNEWLERVREAFPLGLMLEARQHR